MFSLNRIKLIGYLTEKPELRQLPSGVSVCDASLKVISPIFRDGQQQNSTSFHTITFWRWNAENIVKYTDIGSQIYIEGRLKTDSWEDETGKKRYKTKVIADDMILLSPKDGAFPALKEGLAFDSGLNSAEILGNMVKDIEVRQTPNGKSVGSFSVATNKRWKEKDTGEDREETEFHNVVVWDDLAIQGEEHLKKGRKVFINGRVMTRSWDTPDGEKRYTTEIIAENIVLAGHEAPQGGTFSESSSGHSSSSLKSSSRENTVEEMPNIPTIKYESDIKPEDLPF